MITKLLPLTDRPDILAKHSRNNAMRPRLYPRRITRVDGGPVIIIFMFAQLMTSATAVTRTAHKHIDTDTQARVVFDRMALDFAQMLKRTDIDYYVKPREL